MSDRIEIQGKTVEAAVSEALLQMGARRDEVEIKVLEEPKSGFMGFIGGRAAKVLVRRKPSRRRGGGQDHRVNDNDYQAHNLGKGGGRGRGGSRRSSGKASGGDRDGSAADQESDRGEKGGTRRGSRGRGGRGRNQKAAGRGQNQDQRQDKQQDQRDSSRDSSRISSRTRIKVNPGPANRPHEAEAAQRAVMVARRHVRTTVPIVVRTIARTIAPGPPRKTTCRSRPPARSRCPGRKLLSVP